MSNQRVVVLTNEEIEARQKAWLEWASGAEFDKPPRRTHHAFHTAWDDAHNYLVEHPGGITDEQVDRAQDVYDNTLGSYGPMRKALEAALEMDRMERRLGESEASLREC